MEEELEEGESQIAAGGVAADDDLGRVDGRVERSWSGGQEREIGQEAVEESAWEGVLRREPIADGEASTTSQPGEFGGERAMGTGIAEIEGPAVEK